MGSGERHDATPRQRAQHRRRERATLSRVGAAPDLVEQHERARLRVLQDVAQCGDVRRERRQARGDRLPIADVGEHRGEHRERRLGSERRNDAALGHQAQEPDGLDEHRLAARIRTGDEDRELVGREHQVERNDRCLAADEERVAAVADRQRARPDRRGEAVHFHGIARPRAQVIERDTHLPRGRERRATRAQQIRQLAQHAQHFALLFGFRRPQGVAQLDHFGRLDEHCGARGGLVVHDAAHAGARRRADDVAAPAQGDGGIGRTVGRVERAEHRVEPADETLACLAYALARAGETA